MHIAVAYEDAYATEADFIFKGWYTVGQGNCAVVGQVLEGTNIYYYGETPGARTRWAGGHRFCVARPGPYEYRWATQIDGVRSCQGNETLEGFYSYFLPVGGGDNRTDFP